MLQYFDKALAIDPSDKDVLSKKGDALNSLDSYTYIRLDAYIYRHIPKSNL